MRICSRTRGLTSPSSACPHGLHCEVTVAALEAGKHVLVEKPMAVNVEECDAMIAAAQRTGKQLSVGHMHRFSPTNRAVQKLLREQAVGDLVCLCDEAYRPFNPNRRAWYLDKATHGGLWYQNGDPSDRPLLLVDGQSRRRRQGPDR